MTTFKGKVHISTQHTNTLLLDQTIGVVIKGEQTTFQGMLGLQKSLKNHIEDLTKGAYRRLILNSYRSYYTTELDLFRSEHAIIILYILLHSSHLLQLLDISCFAGLKRSYERQIGSIRLELIILINQIFLQPIFQSIKSLQLFIHSVVGSQLQVQSRTTLNECFKAKYLVMDTNPTSRSSS